jgi:hypothetical protein
LAGDGAGGDEGGGRWRYGRSFDDEKSPQLMACASKKSPTDRSAIGLG